MNLKKKKLPWIQIWPLSVDLVLEAFAHSCDF